MSIVELSKVTGLSRAGLYKIMNEYGGNEAKLSSFIKIAKALKIHPITLIRSCFHEHAFPSSLPDNTHAPPLVPFDQTGFIGDITYEDGSMVTTHQQFEKIWRVQNIGDVDWEERKLICMDPHITTTMNGKTVQYGLTPEQPIIPLPLIRAGDIYDVRVTFTAPEYPCTVISTWKMCDAEDQLSFPHMNGLYCMVHVCNPVF